MTRSVRRRTVCAPPKRALFAVAGAALLACGEARRLGSEAWPSRDVQISVDHVRANPRLRETIPECRALPPAVLPDSIGPIRAGQPLAELRAACPEHVLAWDWGFAGVPAPALATRFGDAVVIAVLNDTIPAARVLEVTTADLATPEGLGAGSPLDDALDELGAGRLVEGPCVIEIVFDARPGLSFLLGWPPGELDCEAVADIVADNAVDRLPVETYIRQLTQFVAQTASDSPPR